MKEPQGDIKRINWFESLKKPLIVQSKYKMYLFPNQLRRMDFELTSFVSTISWLSPWEDPFHTNSKVFEGTNGIMEIYHFISRKKWKNSF